MLQHVRDAYNTAIKSQLVNTVHDEKNLAFVGQTLGWLEAELDKLVRVCYTRWPKQTLMATTIMLTHFIGLMNDLREMVAVEAHQPPPPRLVLTEEVPPILPKE